MLKMVFSQINPADHHPAELEKLTKNLQEDLILKT